MPKRNNDFSYWGTISVDHFPARLGSKISFSVIGNFNLASALKQNHKKSYFQWTSISSKPKANLELWFRQNKPKASKVFQAGRTASPGVHIKFWHLDNVQCLLLSWSWRTTQETPSDEIYIASIVHPRSALEFKCNCDYIHILIHYCMPLGICKQICYEEHVSIKKGKRYNLPHSPERSTLLVEQQKETGCRVPRLLQKAAHKTQGLTRFRESTASAKRQHQRFLRKKAYSLARSASIWLSLEKKAQSVTASTL